MSIRIVSLIEVAFLVSFWLQTRINLRQWWPEFFSTPLTSDYLIPFIYLSDILLILLLVTASIHYRQAITTQVQAWTSRNWVSSHGLKELALNPKSWLILFLIITGVILLINNTQWWGWYGWFRLAQGITFAIYLGHRLKQPGNAPRYLAILLIGLLLQSTLMLAQWVTQRSLGLQWLGEWHYTIYTPGIAKIIHNGQEHLRAYGTFAHPNIAAGVLVLGLVMLTWIFVYQLKVGQSNKQLLWQPHSSMVIYKILNFKAAWLTVIAVLSIAMIVAFSRTAWLVAMVGLIAVAIQLPRKHLHRVPIKVWWGIVVGIMVTSLLLGPLVITRFQSLDSTDRLSVERRVQLNEVAINQIEQKPWFGVTINNFIPQLTEYGPLYGVGIWREPVHNLWLLIATEAGMVGLFVWLASYTLIVHQLSQKTLKSSSIAGMLIIVWICIILLSMVDHYWWTSQQGRLLWWLITGASLAAINYQQIKKADDVSI